MEEAVISSAQEFERLIELVERLRSDRGCPWDREQTAEQAKIYLLEEAYEVLEAVDSGSWEHVCGELGDLLFQVLFMTRIFEEAGKFTIREVVRRITEKMIRRHPHVFGDAQVSCADEVKDRWHEIKMAEAKENEKEKASFVGSVPGNLPALMRAYRLTERAARAGFVWPDVKDVIMKADKGLAGLKAALERGDTERSADEFGDLMFTLVNLGRLAGIHPETALTQALSRFLDRFRIIERTLEREGRSLESASLAEMDAIWERCKKHPCGL